MNVDHSRPLTPQQKAKIYQGVLDNNIPEYNFEYRGNQGTLTDPENELDDHFESLPRMRQRRQFSMPSSLFPSPAGNQTSYNPLRLDLAAHLLHDDPHARFLTVADSLAARHAPTSSPLHLHGINYDSTRHQPEPSLATIFNDPITPQQLQRITADAATHAGQSGAMSFFPHPDGVEQLLHMRVPTHAPGRQLSPQAVAEAVNKVTQVFSGDKWARKLLSSHFVYPDETGHSDVLAWVGRGNPNPAVARQAFARLAGVLGTEFNAGPRYWMGTGDVVGGMSPHDDGRGSDSQVIPAAVKVGVPVNPVQFAAAPQHPELRALIEGWLENPRAAVYPKNVIPDWLQENDHPAFPVWDWYQRHAIPASQTIEPTKPSQIPKPTRDAYYLKTLLSGMLPPTGEPYLNDWWGLNPDSVNQPRPGTESHPYIAGSLLRGLRVPSVGSSAKAKESLLDKIYRAFPQHAERIARMVASRELHAHGLLPTDELHKNTHEAIFAEPSDPTNPNETWGTTSGGLRRVGIRPAVYVTKLFGAGGGVAGPHSALADLASTNNGGMEYRPMHQPTYNAVRTDAADAIHRMVERGHEHLPPRGTLPERLRKLLSPLRLAMGGPDWSPQWRPEHDSHVPHLVQGILENPQDTFRHAILADRLDEIGHPHADLLRWYAMEGLPAYLNKNNQGSAGVINPVQKIAFHVNEMFRKGGVPLMHLYAGARIRHRYPEAGETASRELAALGLLPTTHYANEHVRSSPTPEFFMNSLYMQHPGEEARKADQFESDYTRRFGEQGHQPHQLARSPAGTGAVIRGVFYPPGKMMPDLIEGPQAPQQPHPPEAPEPPKIQAPAPATHSQTSGGGGKLTLDRLRGMVTKRRSTVMQGNSSGVATAGGAV